jgi:hypothetical protein
VRSPSKYADTFSSYATSGPGKVNVVAGDVTDPASLHTALAGCDGGVIFAASGTSYFSAKSVDYQVNTPLDIEPILSNLSIDDLLNYLLLSNQLQGVVNTVAEMKKNSLAGPLVLVSSCLVSPHNRMHPIRIMLNNFRWGLMDQKYKSEEFLRSSGINYAVVRPGGLKDGPKGEKTLIVQQGDTTAGSVARADVAAVCVAALTDPAADKVTFELMAGNGDQSAKDAAVPLVDQLKNIFSGLKKD